MKYRIKMLVERRKDMIKKLLQFSLGNKFAIFLMVLLVILGGVYSSAKMKLELLPDVEPPVITVQTTMPGATPETVKEEISDKIDDQIRSMASVKMLMHNLFKMLLWFLLNMKMAQIWIRQKTI